ncbi:hypothetical protein TNCV_1266981 [Trichonephila clavipes]|nr:hypothetical protein TNCV_1266981 [Trichonephila clavipes]
MPGENQNMARTVPFSDSLAPLILAEMYSTYKEKCSVNYSDYLTYILSGDRGSLMVKITDSWLSCHEFEPSTTKDPPCREAMRVKSVESSNVLLLVWYGSWERDVPVQVSSSSLGYGSKLRGPSQKAIVQLNSVT